MSIEMTICNKYDIYFRSNCLISNLFNCKMSGTHDRGTHDIGYRYILVRENNTLYVYGNEHNLTRNIF